MYVLTGLDGIPVAELARSFPWSAVPGEDTDCNVPVRSGRFWAQPVGTTGSVVVFTPEKPVIVDQVALAGGVYKNQIDPETGKLRHAGDLPATGSGVPGIRFDREQWPHGKTGRLSRMELFSQ